MTQLMQSWKKILDGGDLTALDIEIQAMTEAIAHEEMLGLLRERLTELLGLCAQRYRDWSPGYGDPDMEGGPVVQTSSWPLMVMGRWLGKTGWLVVYGIEMVSPSLARVITHMGSFVVEATREQLEEQVGPLQPVLLNGWQRQYLPILLEVMGAHMEVSWTCFEDGSVDLNLYEESDDWLWAFFEEDRRRQAQLDRRWVERLDEEQEAVDLANDRDYCPAYAAGYQEENHLDDDCGLEPLAWEMGQRCRPIHWVKDLPELWGAVPLGRPNGRDQNLDRRTWIRFDTKEIPLVLEPFVKVGYLRETREWESSEGVVKAPCWNKTLFREHWLTQEKKSGSKVMVRPEFHGLLTRAIRAALEHHGCTFVVSHRVDPATITIQRDGEEQVVENRFPRYRWTQYEQGTILPSRRVRTKTAKGWVTWKRCFKCQDLHPQGDHPWMWKRGRRAMPDSPFRELAHADRCLICGSEQGVVDCHVLLPIWWFADQFRIEGIEGRHLAVPIFGSHVGWIMRRMAHEQGGSARDYWRHRVLKTERLHEGPEETFVYPVLLKGRGLTQRRNVIR